MSEKKFPKTLQELLKDPEYRDASIQVMNLYRAINALAGKRQDDPENIQRVHELRVQIRKIPKESLRLIPEGIRTMAGNDGPQAVWNRAFTFSSNADELMKQFPELIPTSTLMSSSKTVKDRPSERLLS